MMQNTLAFKLKELVQQSETRWACKYRRVDAVKSQYAAVTRFLKEKAIWMQVKKFCEDVAGFRAESAPQTGGKRKRTLRQPSGLLQYIVPTTLVC